jgi:hypothetical protein
LIHPGYHIFKCADRGECEERFLRVPSILGRILARLLHFVNVFVRMHERVLLRISGSNLIAFAIESFGYFGICLANGGKRVKI